MAARYWFAVLALLIVYRGWRASVKDNRNAKILRDMTARASCIGELVVLRDRGDGSLRGERFPVARECMLGSSGAADIRIPRSSIHKRHVWMEHRVGCLTIQPIGRAEVIVPGQDESPFILGDGQQFLLGDLTLMMVFYDADSASRVGDAHKYEDEGDFLPGDDFESKDDFFWEDDLERKDGFDGAGGSFFPRPDGRDDEEYEDFKR